MECYYVYILASKKDGVLYTGITSDLIKRTYEHKNKFVKGFSEKYFVSKLVYFEIFDDVNNALAREKQVKHWKRELRVKLIEKNNPNWDDLYLTIVNR